MTLIRLFILGTLVDRCQCLLPAVCHASAQDDFIYLIAELYSPMMSSELLSEKLAVSGSSLLCMRSKTWGMGTCHDMCASYLSVVLMHRKLASSIALLATWTLRGGVAQVP